MFFYVINAAIVTARMVATKSGKHHLLKMNLKLLQIIASKAGPVKEILADCTKDVVSRLYHTSLAEQAISS